MKLSAHQFTTTITHMIFGKTISTFAALATVLASVKDVKLVTESDSSDVNNSPLIGLHEGAGFNFVFLADPSSGKSGDTYKYDDETGNVYKPTSVNGDETANYTLSLDNISDVLVVQESVNDNSPLTVEGGYLAFNGSTSAFFAGKNLTYDPYGYSHRQYALVGTSGQDTIAVKVKVNDA